ncbi:hypothetical protein ACIQZD_09845 [Peribacillus sp. NPDC096447]|uniref:hypothetical protein n=1 Tax=Peribacillus sp. NPDC096447 TaxID=3364394 RepID=UPI00381D5961
MIIDNSFLVMEATFPQSREMVSEKLAVNSRTGLFMIEATGSISAVFSLINCYIVSLPIMFHIYQERMFVISVLT